MIIPESDRGHGLKVNQGVICEKKLREEDLIGLPGWVAELSEKLRQQVGTDDFPLEGRLELICQVHQVDADIGLA